MNMSNRQLAGLSARLTQELERAEPNAGRISALQAELATGLATLSPASAETLPLAFAKYAEETKMRHEHVSDAVREACLLKVYLAPLRTTLEARVANGEVNPLAFCPTPSQALEMQTFDLDILTQIGACQSAADVASLASSLRSHLPAWQSADVHSFLPLCGEELVSELDRVVAKLLSYKEKPDDSFDASAKACSLLFALEPFFAEVVAFHANQPSKDASCAATDKYFETQLLYALGNCKSNPEILEVRNAWKKRASSGRAKALLAKMNELISAHSAYLLSEETYEIFSTKQPIPALASLVAGLTEGRFSMLLLFPGANRQHEDALRRNEVNMRELLVNCKNEADAMAFQRIIFGNIHAWGFGGQPGAAFAIQQARFVLDALQCVMPSNTPTFPEPPPLLLALGPLVSSLASGCFSGPAENPDASLHQLTRLGRQEADLLTSFVACGDDAAVLSVIDDVRRRTFVDASDRAAAALNLRVLEETQKLTASAPGEDPQVLARVGQLTAGLGLERAFQALQSDQNMPAPDPSNPWDEALRLLVVDWPLRSSSMETDLPPGRAKHVASRRKGLFYRMQLCHTGAEVNELIAYQKSVVEYMDASATEQEHLHEQSVLVDLQAVSAAVQAPQNSAVKKLAPLVAEMRARRTVDLAQYPGASETQMAALFESEFKTLRALERCSDNNAVRCLFAKQRAVIAHLSATERLVERVYELKYTQLIYAKMVALFE